jgi:flavin reductase (DIM6/NTAB) family NADH-FMN oxidoreductase RutF
MALADDFKNALASWPSGVSVVTARAGDLAYGVTVSSFSSLSLDPPLILVCLAARSRLPALVRESGAFAVSILASDQADLSSQFARSGREPTRDLAAPGLADAIAHIACNLHQEIEVGDHIILIGRVTEATSRPAADPLLYFRRRYRAVGEAEGPPADAFLGLSSW